MVVIRNPLDIAASLAHHMSFSIDDAVAMIENDSAMLAGASNRLSQQLRQVLSSWAAHVESWVTEPDFPRFVLRYEDLLAEPLARINDLAAFIGVSRSATELECIVENTCFRKLSAQEKISGFREGHGQGRFFRHGRAGGWREELSSDQVERIIESQGNVMRRHGYFSPERL